MPGDEYFSYDGPVHNGGWAVRLPKAEEPRPSFVKWTEVKRRLLEVQRTLSLDYLFDQRD
jgi:hypothetical protein